MLELKQPYYDDHLVIQPKKSLIFLQDGMLGEQVVEKRMLRIETKKRMTVCFDQWCSKINRDSEVQTERYRNEAKCDSDGVGWHDGWLHMLPTGQTLTSEYNQILEKEVKPLTSRRQVTVCPIERKSFRTKKEMSVAQDEATEHRLTLQRQPRHCKRICQTL